MFKVLLFLSFVIYAKAAISFSYGSLGGSIGDNGGGGGGLEGGFGNDIGSGLSSGGGLGGSLGGGLGGGLSSNGGGGGGDGGHYYTDIDYYTIPHYEYQYKINDPKHHDVHEQKEERYGDKVKGEYSLHEPDGTIRIVKYEADKENGFNAVVERRGHAIHPQHYKTYHD